MTSKLRQKCSPLRIIEPLTEKTWVRGYVIFGERKNKERNGETPLRTGKYFEWIIKQLLNSAFVGYEEFCRSRRVLSTSAFRLLWITPSLICRILHILRKPNSIIANYWSLRGKRDDVMVTALDSEASGLGPSPGRIGVIVLCKCTLTEPLSIQACK